MITIVQMRRVLTAGAAALVLVLTACSSSPADHLPDILDDVPEGAASLSIVLLPPILDDHGLEPQELGNYHDLREQVSESGERFSPEGLLVAEIANVDTQTRADEGARWEPLDLGEVDVLLGVMVDQEPFSVVHTRQDLAEVRQGYEDAGFVASDGDVLVLHGPDDEVAEAAAVLEDVVLFGPTPESLESYGDGEGADPSLRQLVEAVTEPRTIAAHAQLELGPDECGAGAAVAGTAAGAQYLVLSAGQDVLAGQPPAFAESAGSAGSAEIDGDLVRYDLELAEGSEESLTTQFFTTYVGHPC